MPATPSTAPNEALYSVLRPDTLNQQPLNELPVRAIPVIPEKKILLFILDREPQLWTCIRTKLRASKPQERANYKA